jgi:D-3-phosphoglycerate dehydrogenase
LTIHIVRGLLTGHTEEDVHDVNAVTLANERGIAIAETSSPKAQDFTDLVRVRLRSGDRTTRVVGTVLGRRNRPHLLEAWGSRFNLQLEGHLAVFRYRDQPGMLGRVGTALGDAGVNIVSAAVGRQPGATGADTQHEAVMIVTADGRVPEAVLDALLAGSDFSGARAVTL